MEIKENMNADDCKAAIKTIDDVRDFFKTIIVDEGVGMAFHPDSDFEDYLKDNGDDFYTSEQAIARDNLLNRAFDLCEEEDEDIYAVAISIWEPYLR